MRIKSWIKSERTINTAAALATYCTLFNVYIWALSNDVEYKFCALLYNYTTYGMIAFYLLDRHYQSSEPFHRQLNKICIYSVFINAFLIILTHHTIITDVVSKFLTFNGLIIAITAIVLDRGVYYGIFKNDE